jgi:hypothetical protein
MKLTPLLRLDVLTAPPGPGRRRQFRQPRNRGATALIAMLFLVLFSTLGIAMYSMATLNTHGADNLADGDKARAAAESGLRWIAWRFSRLQNPKTAVGNITPTAAVNLFPAIRTAIAAEVAGLPDAYDDMTWDPATGVFSSQFIRTEPAPAGNPNSTDNTFQLIVRQHPVNPDPLDSRHLRVTSVGRFGGIAKSVSMDFLVDKKINYAVVGKVPLQLGRNTIVEGPITVTTTNKWPPVLMLSDFRHLTTNLKNKVDAFNAFLKANHQGYDNRIFVNDPIEFAKAQTAGYFDRNGDSYIDEYDLFLYEFDKDGDKTITKSEFTDPATGKLYDADLFSAINILGGPLKAGDTLRPGLSYNPDGTIKGDDVINNNDGYAKVRGQISLAVTVAQWNTQLAPSGKTVNDLMIGPVTGSNEVVEPAVKFGIEGTELLNLAPSAFDTSAFRLKTGPENGPTTKTATLIENKVLVSSGASADTTLATTDERTPYGSTSYQATYRRPVYRNMTFRNVRIPKGTNALFDNCTFEGVTFVELTTTITNSSNQVTTNPSEAMTWSKKMKSGTFAAGTALTFATSYGFERGNNLRFNNCTIKGPLISDVPTAYSHFTNSWEFTGATYFKNEWIDPNSAQSTATIIGPQTNIEMGSFTDPSKAPSTLVGVVVAGNIDIRGTTIVDGSIVITGDGAGNTTQGWFGPSDSATDTATPMPEGGYGHLIIRYNPYRALPDGINMPVDILPYVNEYNQNTYREGM